MRQTLMLTSVAAALALAGAAQAQTYGQPYYRAESRTYGQGYGGSSYYAPPINELDGRAYAATGRAATGHPNGQSYGGHGYGQDGRYGDPHAYRPPAYGGGHGYRGHDRGGRYGYSGHRSNQWTRWSSPPGRGYHDVYGYNDDRAPRGPDRSYSRDCYCGVGAYLYDR